MDKLLPTSEAFTLMPDGMITLSVKPIDISSDGQFVVYEQLVVSGNGEHKRFLVNQNITNDRIVINFNDIISNGDPSKIELGKVVADWENKRFLVSYQDLTDQASNSSGANRLALIENGSVIEADVISSSLNTTANASITNFSFSNTTLNTVYVESAASNLATDFLELDTNGVKDIYALNLSLSSSKRISLSEGSEVAENVELIGTIEVATSDELVVFQTTSDAFSTSDENTDLDIYVVDMSSPSTTISLISQDINGNAIGALRDETLVTNGSIYFVSDANNLVANEFNNKTDIFKVLSNDMSTSRYSTFTDNLDIGNSVSFYLHDIDYNGNLLFTVAGSSNTQIDNQIVTFSNNTFDVVSNINGKNGNDISLEAHSSSGDGKLGSIAYFTYATNLLSAPNTTTINYEILNNEPTVTTTTSLTTDENTATSVIAFSGADVDGDTLTFTFSDPSKGSVVNNGNGTFTYTPSANVTGTDSFTITVNDGTVDVAETVNVMINKPLSDIALTIGTQSSAKLGNKWGSLTDADGKVTASFEVSDTSKDLTLSLTGYDIDYSDEVSLKLNGKSIGNLSKGLDNEASSHSVTLSSSDLQSGTNTIEFVQSTPAWKWGVGEMLLSEVVDAADIALTIGTQSSAKLGNKWGSLTDADGSVTASFEVSDTSKDLTLSLTGYDIDYSDEVSLKLNGKSIGNLSAGRDNETSSHSVTLSASDLQSGTNTIEFVQSTPAWKWGVGEMLLSEVVDAADIALTIGTQSSAKLGNKWGSLTDADGKVTASFEVSDTSKDLTLSLTGYDIDYSDEVSLKLNGKSIGNLSKGLDNEASSHSVTLSSSDLQSGTNTIEFVQSTPAWKWGVGEMLLSEVVDAADIALTIGTQSSAKLGNKWGSLTDADGSVTASFEVSDTSKDLTLSLTGYDIDYSDEVSLKLNGKSIGNLSKGLDNEASSHSVTLSSSDLQSGTNTIEFVQSTPAWKWGVGEMLLSEVVDAADIALTIGTQSSAKLGNKWGSLTDADGSVTASFEVSDTSKDLTLSLTGYDIDYSDEVSLKLNGKSIGNLSKGLDNEASSHSVTLSSSDLQSGTNTIEFVQSTPAWKWGVGEMLLSEVVDAADIALTIGTQSSAKLGNKWGSLTDADGSVTASFEVSDTSKDLTLSLTGYDIDYSDEVSLKLNGKSIGYLSAGRDNETSSHSVTLSASDLQSGTNTIEFVQSTPAWKWGVGEMLLSEVVDAADIALTIGTQSSAKLGNKWGSLTDADGSVTASFEVSDTSKDLTLSLTGYDIDYSDEVSLKLNGKSIGNLSAGRDNETSSHSVTLSASDLQSGTNTIEFVQSTPAWKWGVGEMLLSEVVDAADIALTIGTQSSAKLGNKWGSLTDADGKVTASFEVSDTSKDLTLSLTGYDIDYSDEISHKLNGKSIGNLSAGRDNETSSHSVTLSASDLQSGTNTIEFVQSTPAWKWGVGEMLLSEMADASYYTDDDFLTVDVL